jgi:4-alpha-glucanotransferase
LHLNAVRETKPALPRQWIEYRDYSQDNQPSLILMPLQRSSGILLHPTSLPSRGGIGDFGPVAHDFIRFLGEARQTLWQVLPLGPTGAGNSPYNCISAFAGNPLLVSLERLAERGWIAGERLKSLPDAVSAVNFDEVRAAKMPLLAQAAENFLCNGSSAARQRFSAFREANGWWLEDYVLFEVLRQKYKGATWSSWERSLVRREPASLTRARAELARELEVAAVIQFAFFEQWSALHQECRQRGIRVVGDVAIFVSYDSADVWCNPELFYLDSELRPTVVAGVPPDAYSETGQHWGNPLYRWDVVRARGYEWWVARMRWTLSQCDIVRIDHFRGFEKYWEIPASCPTAIQGRWQSGPGDDFFNALRQALGELPLIAEDLGYITPEVHAMRDRHHLPGMRVLQFGFVDPGAHFYLPHRFHKNIVVYTGTHDNDTTVGWWRSGVSDAEREGVRAYFGRHAEDEINWTLIQAAASSVADLSMVPLQDVLGLGSEARMNTPSRSDGNWNWRFQPGSLTAELAERLGELTLMTDRDTPLSAANQQRDGKVREDFSA